MPLSLFMLPTLLVILVFALTWLLFDQLRTHHPRKYKEMGSPSFRMDEGFRPIIATMKFVCLREHRGLGDRKLAKVSDAMLVCFVVYLALFAYAVSYVNANGLWVAPRSAA